MTSLENIIQAEIAAGGPMRFDRFMELALYHPGFGYYAKSDGPADIGRGGDFFTSVSVGPLFGRLLARQFFQMWQAMGKPDSFWLIEQGAHDGQLGRDIAEWCRAATPDFFAAIRYVAVENPLTLVEERPVGVFFSNELVDAFPVRAVVFREGEWRERCVAIEDEKFVWNEKAIDDTGLIRVIAELRLPAIDGYTTEIGLRARQWMRDVARVLQRGYVLTIDYGYPASLYYARHRTGGTLTAYTKHQRSKDVLAEPGQRDLTAHVDFTALARAGEEAGLVPLGFLDQQHFLTGIAHDELGGKGGPAAGIAENIRAWNTLTHPGHLGAKFFALLQGKDAPANLDGLRYARPGGLFDEALAGDAIEPNLPG